MKNKGSNKVIRAGMWYTIINFVTKGTAYLTTPIFTRIMNIDDIGDFSNINAWSQVLLYLITFDMSVSLSVARFDYEEEIDKYTSSILIYGSVITGVFYLIVLLKLDFFCELFSMPPYAIHILFVYMLVYPALLVYQMRNMFSYKYIASAFISISSLTLSIGCSLVLVQLTKDQLLGRVIGNFVPITLFCIVIYICIVIKGGRVSAKYLSYALKVSFPMIWHSIAIHLLGSGDRIVIKRILGANANALYTVAFTTGTLASALWNAMNSAWSPWSAERMNKGEINIMKKASRWYVLFFMVVILGLLLITPEILYVMGGRQYKEAVYVLPPVIVSCLCQFVYSLYVNAEFYLKKQTRIAVATVIASGLNLLLNFFLIPRFGYVAAAYTTLFGYLFLLVFHFVSLFMLGKKDWYDNKFNFLIIGIFLFLVPLFNLLYHHNSVRYICIILIIFVLIYLLLHFRISSLECIKAKFKKVFESSFKHF